MLSSYKYIVDGNIINGLEFDYRYILNNHENYFKGKELDKINRKKARIYLKAIQKHGINYDKTNEPPTIFEYYLGSTQSIDDIVPAKNSVAEDFWGYYNGSNSEINQLEDNDYLSNNMEYANAVIPLKKFPKKNYAQNGLLKEVKMPMGGTLTYEYEQLLNDNQLFDIIYSPYIGGVVVSKTITVAPENIDKPIIATYEYKKEDGKTSIYGSEIPSNTSASRLKNSIKGPAKSIYKKAGQPYKEQNVSFAINQLMGTNTVKIGLMYLTYTNPIALAISVFVDIAISFINSNNYSFYYSNTNNKMANKLQTGFSRVVVKSNINNGKVINEFTSPTDYPFLIPNLKWAQYSHTAPRQLDWVYGLPKKVIVIDENNITRSISENNYSGINSNITNDLWNNCNCKTNFKELLTSPDWNTQLFSNFSKNTYLGMAPKPYFLKTGRTDLISATTKEYDKNGVLINDNIVKTIIDPYTLLQKGGITMVENNKMLLTTAYFPSDYNISGSAIALLKSNNNIHVPIASEKWLMTINPANNTILKKELIESIITEYKIYNFGLNDEVRPWKVYGLKSKEPIDVSIIGEHNPNALIRNNNYFKLISEYNYDAKGNLIEDITNNSLTSYITDYKERLVIATIANAKFEDCAYTSFEADGKGNWEFDNTDIYIETIPVTGQNTYVVAPNNHITKSNLNATKKYEVYLWKKAGDIFVNGNIGEELTYNSTTGWYLRKYVVTGATQITITGNAAIDELRLHPEGALMSTTTYKMGVGKTAEADANNRILYYEYDVAGRLIVIRDQNKNIIKTYEYNFKK